MADTQHLETARSPVIDQVAVDQQPSLKPLEGSTGLQQMMVARRVARRAVSLHGDLGSSLAGAGAMGDSMAQTHDAVSRKPADVAEQGFSGSGGSIPYKGEMEKSFGVDFSGVKSYSDGPARKANEDLSAHAYTMGNQVAFKSSSPDKSTVAHELTHVLQHTGTIAAKGHDGDEGGIDTSGEGQAEAVEAAVASGKPASSVLGTGPARKAEGPALKSDEGADHDHGHGGGGEGGELDPHMKEEQEKKRKEHGEGTGASLGSAPSLKPTGPARRRGPAREGDGSKFGMGWTFSPEGMEKSYQYEIWKGKGIEIPIAAVPGLNFLVEPSLVAKASGKVNWKEKALEAFLGVEGGVGIGLSYGKQEVASIYGVMEAKAAGGFNYKKEDHKWTLDGSIALSTNFKVGIKLAGGIMDFGFEFGKLELGKLTGIYFENGKFDKGKLGWEWSEQMKSVFATIRKAIDKAKAGAAAVANAGRKVLNSVGEAAKWIASW